MNKIWSRSFNIFRNKIRIDLRIGPIRHYLTRQRNEQIILEFRRGSSIKFLAAKNGVTDNRIHQILTSSGTRAPKWHKMNQENRARVFELRGQGLSQAEIGRKIGVTRERIRQILNAGA